MKRIRYAWPVFGLCLVILLTAMGWITHQALRLDAAEELSRADADMQERTRLALWRLDSAMIPLIIQESARPWHAYNAFMPIEQAFNTKYEKLPSGSIQRPSELMMYDSPDILLHFQVSKEGLITSPQVPNDIELEGANKFQDAIGNSIAISNLDVISTINGSHPLFGLADKIGFEPSLESGPQNPTNQKKQVSERQRQWELNVNENDYRNRSTGIAQQRANSSISSILLPGAVPVSQGKMQPLWLEGKLLLIKRVRVGSEEYVQGCWLSWENIRTWLLSNLDDLLPGSDLVPAEGPPQQAMGEARMANLPVRLIPGKVPDIDTGQAKPLHLTLTTAWACVLLGAACVGLVLAQAISLSQRRGAFVSAVTHELRTPLTTFRLYCDMLAGGMVANEQKRDTYIGRLKAESDRLSHLVENVLAYARLSKPRPTEAMEVLDIDTLAKRLVDRLETRADHSGKTLVVEIEETACDNSVRVDVSRLEQILLNLVDNSCKFTARADDNRVHLSFTTSPSHGVIRIRDHGKGIDPEQLSKLFTVFNRSAHQAAGEAPGIGLGLALSRQLAKDMGGNLRYDTSITDGACFVLTIRLA